MPEGELLQLVAHYRATQATVSGPGAIWFAIDNWEPGLPASWPSAKSPADQARQHAIEAARRQSETLRIIKAGNRAGKSDAAIDAELAANGLTRADQDAP